MQGASIGAQPGQDPPDIHRGHQIPAQYQDEYTQHGQGRVETVWQLAGRQDGGDALRRQRPDQYGICQGQNRSGQVPGRDRPSPHRLAAGQSPDITPEQRRKRVQPDQYQAGHQRQAIGPDGEDHRADGEGGERAKQAGQPVARHVAGLTGQHDHHAQQCLAGGGRRENER